MEHIEREAEQCMIYDEDVCRARLATYLEAVEVATLPQVKEKHLAAARSWQVLLDNVLELQRTAADQSRSPRRTEHA